jgi:proteasome accessory factor C
LDAQRTPYRQQEELLLDILRYGADVEVISPPELRQVIYQRLRNALRQYQVVPEQ